MQDQSKSRLSKYSEILLKHHNRNIWRDVKKSVNGTPENNFLNQAMIHKDLFITPYKRRADVVINHYADVSKIEMSKKNRTKNRNLKIILH